MALQSIFQAVQGLAYDHTAFNYLLYVALTVGIVKLTTTALSFTSLIADLFILPKTDFTKYGAPKGGAKSLTTAKASGKEYPWAVVTGATDGLGKEFAFQLAKKGFNILAVSRNPTTLQTVTEEINTKYPAIQTDFFAIDFANVTTFDAKLAELKRYISEKQLPISILINNVGKSHSIPTPFLETSNEELTDIITINNLATLKFTQVIAPTLAATTKSRTVAKKALILNIGSFSGLLPTPFLATYSGSKAFLQNWSASLATELAPLNIDVHNVLAYLITSKMSKVRRTSFLIPNPHTFVESTLNTFQRRGGAQEKYATVTPYWSHAIMHWAIELTVGVFSGVANKINYSMHLGIRKRALKKQARKAKEN